MNNKGIDFHIHIHLKLPTWKREYLSFRIFIICIAFFAVAHYILRFFDCMIWISRGWQEIFPCEIATILAELILGAVLAPIVKLFLKNKDIPIYFVYSVLLLIVVLLISYFIFFGLRIMTVPGLESIYIVAAHISHFAILFILGKGHIREKF